MDRGFQKWLAKRGIQPGTIAILQKESILHENTLKLLRQADLELLRTKHDITMGQFALLRTAHGDLLGTDEDGTDEDGFEMIGMEDVPAELGGGGGDQQQAPAGRSRKNSRGEKCKAHDKRQQVSSYGVLPQMIIVQKSCMPTVVLLPRVHILKKGAYIAKIFEYECRETLTP